MVKMSLPTIKSETCFQSFVLARDESRAERSSDLDQDALRESVNWKLHKSPQELALDINTSQSTVSWKSKERWAY